MSNIFDKAAKSAMAASLGAIIASRAEARSSAPKAHAAHA
jgi:hypothetical protein